MTRQSSAKDSVTKRDSPCVNKEVYLQATSRRSHSDVTREVFGKVTFVDGRCDVVCDTWWLKGLRGVDTEASAGAGGSHGNGHEIAMDGH